jgi:ABC-2 type transport system permease protein
MSQTRALLSAKVRMGIHALASVRNESKLKVGVVSVAAVLLWIGALYGFMEAFDWLRHFGVDVPGAVGIGDIIMARMLSVFSLALFFMLIFSNVLIAFSTLYTSREMAYLLQTPIPIRRLFLARFVECAAFSSWASAYIGSPLLLAYGVTTQAPWLFYVAPLAFYVPYVVLPAALGATAAIVLVRIFPKLRLGAIIGFSVAAVAALFLYFQRRIGAVEFATETLAPTLLSATAQVQSPYLPSFWAAHGVLLAAMGEVRDSFFFLLLILSNALMATWLACEAAALLFYPGWSRLAGSARNRGKALGKGPARCLWKALGLLREPAHSLTVKDIKLFWRDPTQWSQFVIFFGLMAVYIASLHNRSLVLDSEIYRSWVACLNTGACTLILATLTSRFVFPLVSLEGRRFWVLGLAPVTLRQLVWQKFCLSVATTSVFTVGLVVLSSYLLEIRPAHFLLSVYSISATNFALSGLAVGLGSLYPNFQEDNPARIVSGMGGTLNFLLSLAYLVVVVGAQTIVMQWRVMGVFHRPALFWWAFGGVIVFVGALSTVSTLLPMRLGLSNLERMEF